MINNNKTGPTLLTSITNLVNMLLRGKCHRDVVLFLFGGRLSALEMTSGGVSPIALVILFGE